MAYDVGRPEAVGSIYRDNHARGGRHVRFLRVSDMVYTTVDNEAECKLASTYGVVSARGLGHKEWSVCQEGTLRGGESRHLGNCFGIGLATLPQSDNQLHRA